LNRSTGGSTPFDEYQTVLQSTEGERSAAADGATSNGDGRRRWPAARPRPGGVACLLDHLPDLGDDLPDAQVATARRVLTVPVIVLDTGRYDLDVGREDPRVTGRLFGILVIRGLLVREIHIAGQASIHLCGPGDLLGHQQDVASSLPTDATLTCPDSAGVAMLDDRAVTAMRHWPSITYRLFELMMQQLDQSQTSTAISGLSSVEARLLALFWHLADRWGRRRADAVTIDLPLTHEAVGQLIGARRPTVSLGLRALDDENLLHRDADGTWLLDPGSLQRLSVWQRSCLSRR